MVCDASKQVSGRQLSSAPPPVRRQEPMIFRHRDLCTVFKGEFDPVGFTLEEWRCTTHRYCTVLSETQHSDRLLSTCEDIDPFFSACHRIKNASPGRHTSTAGQKCPALELPVRRHLMRLRDPLLHLPVDAVGIEEIDPPCESSGSTHLISMPSLGTTESPHHGGSTGTPEHTTTKPGYDEAPGPWTHRVSPGAPSVKLYGHVAKRVRSCTQCGIKQRVYPTCSTHSRESAVSAPGKSSADLSPGPGSPGTGAASP